MATCRSCGARITWLKTAAGKSMPVNEDPNLDGNIVATEGTNCRVAKWYDPAMPRYMPHWATCPNAREWRP